MRPAVRATAVTLLGVALALVNLGGAAPARAVSVTDAEFRALARDAPTDRSARERLLSVTAVGGKVVDTRTALGEASGADFDARLAQLVAELDSTPASGASADQSAAARAEARDVLRARKFHASHAPRPLRGVLHWLGERLSPVVRPFADLWNELTRTFAGQLAVVSVVLGAGALVITALIRRRTAAGVARARRRRVDQRAAQSPLELDRLATSAAADGDFSGAVRLRFLAGLLRLDEAGVLPYRPSLTTRGATRSVHSRTLADLGQSFDEIVYGGRPADRDDVDRARDGWPRALVEAGETR